MVRTNRLFEHLGILRARKMPITAVQLADELGVSPRSIYRDAETLRSLGAPLDGEAGIGYQLRPGFFLPEFAFSPDEMDAPILGLGWVQLRADQDLARSSESALAKILSAKGRSAETIDGAPTLAPVASITENTDPPQAAVLRDAIRQQRKVEIVYRDARVHRWIALSGRSSSSTSTTCASWAPGASSARPSAISASTA